jgi:hemerythrin-like domain-containing protein
MPESPTGLLKQEHEVVLVVVAAMEREVDDIRRTDTVDAARVADMVDFTRNFTDGCHHAKEEDVLFPLMEQTQTAAGGPVSVMLSEHDAGRAYVRGIVAALPDVETSAAARAQVSDSLAGYAYLLRLHINKENAVLFPMADKILSDDDQAYLACEFERIEREETGAGVHDRYHEMARRLSEPRPS